MAEFIYNEQDMQIARNALEYVKKQYQDAQAIIWAMAMKSGGNLQIDQRLLMEANNKGNVLTTWNHPTELLFCIRASRPTKDAPDFGESAASDSESNPAPKRVI